MELDKIIADNRGKFKKWDEQLSEHLEKLYNPEKFDLPETERVFFQTNELLINIANNFFSYGKFKDTWDTSKCYLNVFGQNLLLVSKKMDLSFHWGLDRDHFYLESYITNPENIRYMTDDFWSILLELKSCGTFEYTGAKNLDAKERPYFENRTSVVFQLARNFVINQIERMPGNKHQNDPWMDLGNFIITWPAETTFEELLRGACKAFKLCYTINYQLWKISDLGRKQNRKRI